MGALCGARARRGSDGRGGLRRRGRRGYDDDATPSRALTQVTLQSKWVVQAQFAGYYAAVDQGFYEDEGLDVTIRAGGPDIVPEQVVLGRTGRVRDQLARQPARDPRPGAEPRQHRARSSPARGMTEVTWKDSGLDKITKLEGKKFGVWLGGNEHKLFAALTKNGLDPQEDVRDRRAAVRHEPLPEPRGGRGRRDDLQRARAGARGREPGHGRAVHARTT